MKDFIKYIEQTAQACRVWPVIADGLSGAGTEQYSSGGSTRHGGITKTGNSHGRRVLVEAAWTYRHAARKTAVVQRRAERTPQVIQDIAWSAQKRLCQRYRAGGQRQVEGASVHGRRARTGWFYMGNWPRTAAGRCCSGVTGAMR
jgi:hypothetical protein